MLEVSKITQVSVAPCRGLRGMCEILDGVVRGRGQRLHEGRS